MAIIYATVAVVWKWVKPIKWRLFSLIAIYISLFFTAGQGVVSMALGLKSILHMFPYFVFGLLVLKPFEVHNNLRVAIPCSIFFLLVVFLEGDVRSNGMAFYWVTSDWRSVIADKHLFLCFWARTAVGIAGSIFLLWTVEKVLKLVPRLEHLSAFGTTTLGVYVMHEWPLIQIHKYFSFDPLPYFWRWPLTFALFFLCHFITIGIKSNMRIRLFFFGDPKWLASRINKWLTRKD